MILNFNLSQVASLIVQVTALFDPEPPFQYSVDNLGNFNITPPNQLVRDMTVLAPVFPSSVDTLGPANGVIPLPSNAYVINFPALVYGAAAPNDTSYSVVQIDTSIAKIEPGFSRVRIDYLDQNGNPVPPQYFDCPFYEIWDTTARELNNIVNYMEEAVNFLQKEINAIDADLAFLDSRLFMRGTTVSGQIQWTPTTQGLVSGPLNRGQFSHSMPECAINLEAKVMLPKSALIYPPPLPTSQPEPSPYYAIDPNAMMAANNSSALGGLARVSNGNYIYGYFGFSAAVENWLGTYWLTENTDGTLTFMWFNASAFSNPGDTFYMPIQFYMSSGTAIDVSVSGSQGENIQVHFNTAGSSGSGLQYTLDTQINQPSIYGQAYEAYSVFNPNSYSAINTSLTGQISLYNPKFNTNVPVFVSVLRPVGGPGTSVSLPVFQLSNKSSQPLNTPSINATSGQSYNFDVNNNTTNHLVLRGATNNSSGGATITSFTGLYGNNLGCPGDPITVNGTGFDQTYNVYLGSTAYPASNVHTNQSTVLLFNVPTNMPAGAYQIILKNSQYTVTSADYLIVGGTPTVSSVLDTTSNQTNQGAVGETVAILGTNFGVQAQGSVQFFDYTNITTIPITPTSWSTTEVDFVIPSVPPGNYGLIFAAGCGNVGLPFTVVNRAPVGPPPTLVIQPNTVNMTDGQVQQFYAYVIQQNQQPRDVSTSSTWLVNNIVGGDTNDGTITQQGNYTAPNPVIAPAISTVTANYTYEGQPNDPYNGTPLTASASVNLAPIAHVQSPYSTITVRSQINVFLGDGRSGYVPTGTTTQLWPAQVLFVQFNEKVSPSTKIPVISPNDVQLLTLQTKNMLDPDIANAMYNLGDYTLDPNSGLLLTHRTVVLGIIDPTDGLWHSMWDIGLPLPPPPDNDSLSMHSLSAKSLPNNVYYASTLPAFSSGSNFDGSLLDYIDNITDIHQSDILTLQKRNNLLLIGNCFFDESTDEFEVLDSIIVLGAKDENKYGVLGTIEKQKIIINKGEILFINPNFELKVIHVGQAHDDLANSKSIIVGANLDKFYTKWPILTSGKELNS